MQGFLRRLETSSSGCYVLQRRGWAGTEQAISRSILSSLILTGMVSETACLPLPQILRVQLTRATLMWWKMGSLPW